MRWYRAQTGQIRSTVKQAEAAGYTYIYAAWEPLGGEEEVEIEFISARLQPPVRAEYLLVLKQRRVAMARVPRSCGAADD